MSTGTLDERTARSVRRRMRLRAWIRVPFAIGAWLLAINATVMVANAVLVLTDQRSDNGSLTYEKTLGTDGALGMVVGTLGFVLAAVIWGLWATRVDYRWFDGFCLLVPLYGMFWSGRIVWRLTYPIEGPHARNWPPAADRRENWFDRLAQRLDRAAA